jgi:hypothetical protein
VGKNVIFLIREQYLKQSRRVLWEGGVSKDFSVDMGVKQGSPLSPMLFALVIDDVVEEIRKLDVGCWVDGVNFAILVYADDVLILGPTLHCVQKLLDELKERLVERGLEINANKTRAMEVGREKKKRRGTLWMGEKKIEWVKELRYLGMWLEEDGGWDVQMKKAQVKMNKAGNVVINKFRKIVGVEEMILLLESIAFDLYGLECSEKVTGRVWEEIEKSYHWLVKRALGKKKRSGNHVACAEGRVLTFGLRVLWNKRILWEGLTKCKNELVEVFFGKGKWETVLGKSISEGLMEYGKEALTVGEFKDNLGLFVEGMAVMKEVEWFDASL